MGRPQKLYRFRPYRTKITIMRTKSVQSFDDEGNLVKTYQSVKDAETEMGLACGSISKVLNSKIRARGYFWRAKNGHEPVKEVSEIYVTEQQLHERHDMLYRIMLELEKIPEGAYIEESVLLKKLGILGKPGYRSAVEHPDLKKYKGKVDHVVYYGHPESIERNKTKGLLS